MMQNSTTSLTLPGKYENNRGKFGVTRIMASLTITSGELQGQKIDIDKDELSIGRSDQNTISLDDPAASGKHCIIVRDGNKYTLKDLRSTNGTRLNGRNIVESRLKPGDVITVGVAEMTVDGPEIEIEPEPEPITRANTTHTVIMAPVRTIAPINAPPSPAFQTKKDNRPLLIAVIVICVILVAVAIGLFVVAMMK